MKWERGIKNMHEIKTGGTVLARHITQDDIKPGLNFFSGDAEFVQVGIWGHYGAGKEMQAHIHNPFDRVSSRTCEVLYVIKGRVEASIYDLKEELVEQLPVNQGEILILLECGHGYRIMSEDTTVLEVKNGPYAGAEKDRYRF